MSLEQCVPPARIASALCQAAPNSGSRRIHSKDSTVGRADPLPDPSPSIAPPLAKVNFAMEPHSAPGLILPRKHDLKGQKKQNAGFIALTPYAEAEHLAGGSFDSGFAEPSLSIVRYVYTYLTNPHLSPRHVDITDKKEASCRIRPQQSA